MNPLETVREKEIPWAALGELSGLKALGDIFGHDFIKDEFDAIKQKVLIYDELKKDCYNSSISEIISLNIQKKCKENK